MLLFGVIILFWIWCFFLLVVAFWFLRGRGAADTPWWSGIPVIDTVGKWYQLYFTSTTDHLLLQHVFGVNLLEGATVAHSQEVLLGVAKGAWEVGQKVLARR